MTDLQWYVIRTKPPANQNRTKCKVGGAQTEDFVVRLILLERGFSVFFPTEKRWNQVSKYSTKKRLVTKALAPGWVWVGWPIGQERWADLFAVDMVSRVIAVDGKPYRFPNTVMADLFDRWDRDANQAPDHERFMRTHVEFNEGDMVRVTSGPFEGQTFPVLELKGPMASGLVTFLAEERVVDFNAWDLEVA